MSAPEVYEASAEKRYATAPAISCGSPARRIGMFGARSSGAFGRPAAAWISVCVVPGETVLTRTPTGPNSFDAPVVSAFSAA